MKRKKKLSAVEAARQIADAAAAKANDPKAPQEVRAVAAELRRMWMAHCKQLGFGFEDH